ncbi:unnamed protein product [Gordionus sp. m RMFG-2023]
MTALVWEPVAPLLHESDLLTCRKLRARSPRPKRYLSSKSFGKACKLSSRSQSAKQKSVTGTKSSNCEKLLRGCTKCQHVYMRGPRGISQNARYDNSLEVAYSLSERCNVSGAVYRCRKGKNYRRSPLL